MKKYLQRMNKMINRIVTSELPGLISELGQENVVVIDARDKKKFDNGHFPGAVSVDISVKNENLKLLGFMKKSAIFIYCEYGIRTQSVIEKLKDAQYKGDIYRITGEIEEWINNGFNSQ